MGEQSIFSPQAVGDLLPALQGPDAVAEAQQSEAVVERDAQAEDCESEEELDVLATRGLTGTRRLGGREGLVGAVQDAVGDEVDECGCADDVG